MHANFSGFVQDDFLDEHLCNYLVSLLPKINWEDNDKHGYWSNRTCSPWGFANQVQCAGDAELIFSVIASKINMVFREKFLKQDLHPDTLDIVRWPSGFSQTPHADACSNNGQPNEYHYRSYGAIIYLNESFSGGLTYYPNLEMSIEPRIGRLAIHPGDAQHLHGVSEVTNGVRYTIASFWTSDKTHQIGVNHNMDISWI